MFLTIFDLAVEVVKGLRELTGYLEEGSGHRWAGKGPTGAEAGAGAW